LIQLAKLPRFVHGSNSEHPMASSDGNSLDVGCWLFDVYQIFPVTSFRFCF
jgi:hypothetical protein